ncbi:hypothetical protein L0152_11035 [bacterium]|nr:hypothetical protein [bacterium]
MEDVSKWMEDFVNELWFRFRAIALAIDQTQRFVAIAPGTESIQEQKLWLKKLPDHPEEVSDIARDLVLRAFRVAVDITNYKILQSILKEPWVASSELMKESGLNTLSLSERVNDLIQVGLVVKDVQTGQVQGTQAAQRLVELIEEMQHYLSNVILEKFQDLKKKANP